jgi:hypothetical protein
VDFPTFRRRAHEIFDGIPPEYREGVDGLEVSRGIQAHPSLPEVYTLGECKSEFYPSEFGGAGEVRSIVVLHYGSFLELSRREEEWSWEDELWETITHEIRHHLESLASEDALEVQDYAEDQNFARREGEPFDPFFFRSGNRLEEGVWEVDGDVFVELAVDPARFGGPEPPRARWRGAELSVPWPDRLGDVHFVRVPGAVEEPAELFLVLVRTRGAWESLRALLRRAPLEVLESGMEMEGGA